jgi:hypothetical protein
MLVGLPARVSRSMRGTGSAMAYQLARALLTGRAPSSEALLNGRPAATYETSDAGRRGWFELAEEGRDEKLAEALCAGVEAPSAMSGVRDVARVCDQSLLNWAECPEGGGEPGGECGGGVLTWPTRPYW